jgi:hypothetical protein
MRHDGAEERPGVVFIEGDPLTGIKQVANVAAVTKGGRSGQIIWQEPAAGPARARTGRLRVERLRHVTSVGFSAPV